MWLKRSLHPHTTIAFSILALILTSIFIQRSFTFFASDHYSPITEDDLDERLQRASLSALGNREGTIIAMDPQTGRIRAIVNERLAFEESFTPGSTIKPFTTLVALRAGLISDESHLLCRTLYKRADVETHCSHPQHKPPFNLVQALAYSCNYYFANLGEQLNSTLFNDTLTSFGFGTRTTFDRKDESSGALPRGEWRVRFALGDDPQLLMTPVQLITAYSALINGGRLFSPRISSSQDFLSHERAKLSIGLEHRQILIKGMRGAVAYGTAGAAGLGTLDQFVFGKTGTATPNDDFRNHGWFVGFAADRGTNATTSPESVSLVVLVFMKRTQGADCAEAARIIFEEYARAQSSQGLSPTKDEPSRQDAKHTNLRVRLLRQDATETLSLDDYLFGVMAAEASVEDEFEALKAQAVISRTFALKNLNRHSRDGYDLCNNTHCQRFMLVQDTNTRPDFYALVRRAIRETEGETLRDAQGRLAETYFSASCGGARANIETLWGTRSPSYLRGGFDPFCTTLPDRNWTDTISVSEMLRALNADPRSTIGSRLDDVRIVKRDVTERAEIIAIEGEWGKRVLRGWDFKIIIGRTLGWNLLKSTRFTVTRNGTNLIFSGSGFGHGLGLCQQGAHVMAERGSSYRQIIEHYFPGTTVRNNADLNQLELSINSDIEQGRNSSDFKVDDIKTQAHPVSYLNAGFSPQSGPISFLSHLRSSLRQGGSHKKLTLSNQNFRIFYSPRLPRRDAEVVLQTLEAARDDLISRLAAASLQITSPQKIDVTIHDSTGEFVETTGAPSWIAATTRAQRIDMQPFHVLRRRNILRTTLRHELVHAIINQFNSQRSPRWLLEGMAIHFSGEAPMLARLNQHETLSLSELDQKLERPASEQETRLLYMTAYREASELIRKDGEPALWRRVVNSKQ